MRRPFVSRETVIWKNGGHTVRYDPPIGGYGRWRARRFSFGSRAVVVCVPYRMTMAEVRAQNAWVSQRANRRRYRASWLDAVIGLPRRARAS